MVLEFLTRFQAMNSYHKSVQIAPSGAGYFNIGVCYFQMGKCNI